MEKFTTSAGSRICTLVEPLFSWKRRFVSLNTDQIPTQLLTSSSSAGQDVTEQFYALHRHEVLQRPQYARLQVGTIQGEQPLIASRVTGELSSVPYAEPTWLSQGYHSPYYKEVCSCTVRTQLYAHIYERATEIL